VVVADFTQLPLLPHAVCTFQAVALYYIQEVALWPLQAVALYPFQAGMPVDASMNT
jgi:hypothetical protein